MKNNVKNNGVEITPAITEKLNQWFRNENDTFVDEANKYLSAIQDLLCYALIGDEIPEAEVKKAICNVMFVRDELNGLIEKEEEEQ